VKLIMNHNPPLIPRVSPYAVWYYESAVEDAIATCNGDLRGALKALIIANEFLERDIERLARKCVAN